MNNSFGLTAAQLTEIQKILKTVLGPHRHFAVSVFGSRARGDHKQYSDLDLWLESSPSISDMELVHLVEQFQESDLPIKIDVVDATRVLPEYLASIRKEKIFWFSN